MKYLRKDIGVRMNLEQVRLVDEAITSRHSVRAF